MLERLGNSEKETVCSVRAMIEPVLLGETPSAVEVCFITGSTVRETR